MRGTNSSSYQWGLHAVHGPRQPGASDFSGLALTNAGSGSPWQCWLNKLTTHSGRPPVYSNSMLAALMGICWHTRAETLTVTALVTATGVCQAVGVKPGDINLETKISLTKNTPVGTAKQHLDTKLWLFQKAIYQTLKHERFHFQCSLKDEKKCSLEHTIKSCPALSNTVKSMIH